MWPPETVDRCVKEVRLYIRTVLSAQAVAMMGREGCGHDCQVREVEGGWRVARGVMVRGGMVGGGESERSVTAKIFAEKDGLAVR